MTRYLLFTLPLLSGCAMLKELGRSAAESIGVVADVPPPANGDVSEWLLWVGTVIVVGGVGAGALWLRRRGRTV